MKITKEGLHVRFRTNVWIRRILRSLQALWNPEVKTGGLSLDLAKQWGQQKSGLGTGNSKGWILSLREPIPRQKEGGTAGEWLRGLDSNQDSRLQRPMCYQLHHPGVVDNEGKRHWRPDAEGKSSELNPPSNRHRIERPPRPLCPVTRLMILREPMPFRKNRAGERPQEIIPAVGV